MEVEVEVEAEGENAAINVSGINYEGKVSGTDGIPLRIIFAYN